MNTSTISELSREAWSHALLLRLAGVAHVPAIALPPLAPAAPPTTPPAAPRFDPAPRPDALPAAAPADAAGGASAPPSAPALLDAGATRLEQLAAEVAACTSCPLHQGRKQTVFGDGGPGAPIMFIGEGPGADEDRIGRPFVGRAGELLDRIIEAMGFQREEVYIGNVVKCRPPGNRAPEADEMAACMGFLRAQIDVVQPRVIVLLGATAARGLLNTTTGITRLRGNWRDWMGIPVMPTFHPAYLLRLSGDALKQAKRQVWQDVQAARDRARGDSR